MKTFLKTAAAASVLVGLAACASAPEPEPAPAPAPAPEPVAEPEPMPEPEVVKPAPVVETYTGPTRGSVEDFRVNVGERVYFDLDQSRLDADDREILMRQAAWLQSYPETRILVAGNCDERGTREYNLALGERRAATVKDYLVSQGVDPARIDTISYGKERPIAAGSNEQAWAQNRNGFTQITSGAVG
ncbi:MAG: peptidoglycan-associated lipoprotein Pal [Pseudomonadota bacterium]